MNAHDSSYFRTCHRCQRPMELHSQEIVGGDTMQVFRCEHCDMLEAVRAEKAA